MEDLAYRRLLDQYYLREGPLPFDIQVTAKLVRMRSMAADVESVLKEFFTLTDSGWTHDRCEAEIAHMQDKQVKARASAAASVKSRQAFAAKKSQTSGAPASQDVSGCSTDAQNIEAGVQLPTPTPTPTPVLKKTSAIAPPVGVSESVWTDFCQHRKSKGAKLTQTALDGIQAEAAKAGWRLEDALRECCTRGWTGFKAEWVADRPTAQRANAPESFKSSDARAARARWEEMTGRTHPDNLAQAPQRTGMVLDITPRILEIEQ
jgi:uncharacterized protein YdaU (DUF1376 family)